MDKKISIGLQDLEVLCIIGVLREERLHEQKISIDLEITYDACKCIEKDDLKFAIDYTALSNLCEDIAQSKKFHLLESYANFVVETLFSTYPILSARICVRKLRPFINVKNCFVVIERGI